MPSSPFVRYRRKAIQLLETVKTLSKIKNMEGNEDLGLKKLFVSSGVITAREHVSSSHRAALLLPLLCCIYLFYFEARPTCHLDVVGGHRTTCYSFILSFHHVSSGDRTQDIGLSGRYY